MNRKKGGLLGRWIQQAHSRRLYRRLKLQVWMINWQSSRMRPTLQTWPTWLETDKRTFVTYSKLVYKLKVDLSCWKLSFGIERIKLLPADRQLCRTGHFRLAKQWLLTRQHHYEGLDSCRHPRRAAQCVRHSGPTRSREFWVCHLGNWLNIFSIFFHFLNYSNIWKTNTKAAEEWQEYAKEYTRRVKRHLWPAISRLSPKVRCRSL